MPNKFARSNGDFNNAAIWSLSATGLSATTVPTIGDNAIANTFTIQITGNVACDNITNGTAYGGLSGGGFLLNSSTQSVNLSCNVRGSSFANTNTYCLTAAGNLPITHIGTIFCGNNATAVANPVVLNINTSVYALTGNITSPVPSLNNNGTGFVNASGTAININGNVLASFNGGVGLINVRPGADITIIGDVMGSANNSYGISLNSQSNLTIYGTVYSNSGVGSSIGGWGVYVFGSATNSNVQVYGNLVGSSVSGGNDNGALRNDSNSSITVRGNINGTSQAALLNTSTGPVTVYGNLNASSASALSNTSTGSVTVYGNLNASIASAISNSSTGSVTIAGNVIGDSRGGAGIASSNAAANVRISGNLIGAPNGIPAVYAASYTVNPVPYQTYIRYANNGTGVGSDAYLYHYTTDSLSAFSIPPVSAVRAGLQYANNTLTGTCQMPAASAVNFGALVGNTSGTAAITSNTLFDVSVASLTASDSLGARLKNSATVESVGRIIASFSN